MFGFLLPSLLDLPFTYILFVVQSVSVRLFLLFVTTLRFTPSIEVDMQGSAEDLLAIHLG